MDQLEGVGIGLEKMIRPVEGGTRGVEVHYRPSNVRVIFRFNERQKIR
jgi:hypothetical protein